MKLPYPATYVARRRAALLGLALLSAALSGCGYSTTGLLRQDIRTVHVAVFDNQTWRRGLEVELTRALVRELTLHTHLRIASKEEADSTLRGELLEFEQDSLQFLDLLKY